MRYLIAIVVLLLFIAVTWQSSNSYWRFNGDATIRWSTNLIYQLNLLELKNINDWNINE